MSGSNDDNVLGRINVTPEASKAWSEMCEAVVRMWAAMGYYLTKDDIEGLGEVAKVLPNGVLRITGIGNAPVLPELDIPPGQWRWAPIHQRPSDN